MKFLPLIAHETRVHLRSPVGGFDLFHIFVRPGADQSKREQGEAEATAAAAFIANACNLHALLLEYFHASNSFNFTVGHEDATVEDERKAEERFDAAAIAVLAALAAAGAA